MRNLAVHKWVCNFMRLCGLVSSENRGSPGGIQPDFLCLLATRGSLWIPRNSQQRMPGIPEKAGRYEWLSLPSVKAYIHQQSLIQRGSAQGCAGTSRTCRCKYHNEHLRSCYKGSQADFRKTARQSGRSRIKKLSLIFSREGKSKGKGQARGRENAENTKVCGDKEVISD